MTTYQELGLSKTATGKILSAASKPNFHQLATPEGLRQWLAAGNDLSDAVEGIGEVTEKAILEALTKLPPSDQAAGDQADADNNDVDADEDEAPIDTEIEADQPVEDVKVIRVAMEVPVAQMRGGYEARQAMGGKLNFGRISRKTQVHLSPEEAVCFLQIREGLLRNDKRLPNGEPIKSNADVVRWLLSQVITSAV